MILYLILPIYAASGDSPLSSVSVSRASSYYEVGKVLSFFSTYVILQNSLFQAEEPKVVQRQNSVGNSIHYVLDVEGKSFLFFSLFILWCFEFIFSTPLSHKTKSVFYMPADLRTSKKFYVRVYGVKQPLERPYQGPYDVIKRHKHYFTLRLEKRRRCSFD